MVGRWHDVRVVWKADLAVEQGSIVAMIRSNGAGKPTLLRAISGMLASSSGEIVFTGEAIRAASPPEFVKRGLIHPPEGRRLFADFRWGTI